MNINIKSYTLDFFSLLGYLALIATTAVFFYFLFSSNLVISWLEENQISVYFIKDSILLIFLTLIVLGFIKDFIESYIKKDLSFLSTFFKPIPVLLISAYFAVSYDYGNVSRSKIGWFYSMPKGESISYPK